MTVFAHRDMRCIERLPSGQYRCRLRRTRGGQKKQYVYSEAGSYEDAIAARRHIENEERLNTAAGGLTVRQWCALWIADLKRLKAEGKPIVETRKSRKRRKRSSAKLDVKNIESHVNAHILQSELAGMPVRAIKPAHIEKFLEWLSTRPAQIKYPGDRTLDLIGERTQQHIFTTLGKMFDFAIADPKKLCRCKSNPTAGLVVATEEDHDDVSTWVAEDRPLKPAEQSTLLNAFGDDPERWLAQFAIGTGVRQGEQWNLELVDVHLHEPDPENPGQTISYVFIRWGSKGLPPKNGQSRKVPLFGLGLEAMERWLEILPQYAPCNPEGLAFPTKQIVTSKNNIQHRGGYRRGKSHVPPSFEKLQKAKILGADRDFNWHAFRHTCATGMLSNQWGRKWDLVEISKVLGHKSLAVTQMYAKFVDNAVFRAAAEAHQAFEQLQGRAAPAKPPAPPLPPAPPPVSVAAAVPSAEATLADAVKGLVERALRENNFGAAQSLLQVAAQQHGAPLSTPPPTAPTPQPAHQHVPAPAPVPPQPPLPRTLRKGPAGRRSRATVASEGDTEGPRKGDDPLHQLTASVPLTGLHSGSFTSAPGSLDGLIVASAAPAVTSRPKLEARSSATETGAPLVHPAEKPTSLLVTLLAAAASTVPAPWSPPEGAPLVHPKPAFQDSKRAGNGPWAEKWPRSGHDGISPERLQEVNHTNCRSTEPKVGRSNRPGRAVNSDSYEDSADGYGHHVATAPSEDERGPPQGRVEESERAPAPGPLTEPTEAAPDESHLAKAQRLMKAVARGRQDAWRMAEDLAVALLMSPEDKRHHEAATLILKYPELRVPRALELAVRLIGPEPKPKAKPKKRAR